MSQPTPYPVSGSYTAGTDQLIVQVYFNKKGKESQDADFNNSCDQHASP